MGLILDIDEHDLKVIQKDNDNDLRACGREMFSLWLRKSGDQQCYRQLLEALCKAEEFEAAKQLQEWFGKTKMRTIMILMIAMMQPERSSMHDSCAL